MTQFPGSSPRSWSLFALGALALTFTFSRAATGVPAQTLVTAPPATGGAVTPPDDAPNGDYKGLFTWPEIRAQIDAWKRTYPTLIAESSLGQTFEGRAIPLLKVTAPGKRVLKPESLLLFGVHPREQAPTLGMMRLVGEMLSGYGHDARMTKLLDGHTIWIIPMLNVDGKVYDMQHGDGTSRGADWRKNRHPNPDGTVGVDLNRNFPVRWGGNRRYDPSWKSATNRTTGDIYEGLAPASEPEVQALMNFVIAHPNLRLMVDIHSPLHEILAPTYLIKPEYERYTKLLTAMRATQREPYPLGNIKPDTEPNNAPRGGNTGISYTWTYYTRGVTSLNIEIGEPKLRGVRARYPPPASMEAEYVANVRGPLLIVLEASGDMPVAKAGKAILQSGDLSGRLAPGAKVTWTPTIAGACDYAVLTSSAPALVVASEYRLVPVKLGFGLEVSATATPGTKIPLTLYMWNKKHEVSTATFSLTVSVP